MKRMIVSVLLLGLMLGCSTTRSWRAVAPDSPRAPRLADLVPEVQALEASSGLTVLVAQRSHAPLVSIEIVFRGGHSEDPAGKEGLAALSYTLLAEKAYELVDEGCEGSAFGTSELPRLVIDHDGARIGATVLARDLEPTLARLALALKAASVDEESLERAIAGRAAVSTSGLGFTSERAVARTLLGRDHGLARSTGGSAASRANVKVEDVEAFLAAQARPDRMAVVVAGPVEPSEISAAVDRCFEGWGSRKEMRETPAETPSSALLPGGREAGEAASPRRLSSSRVLKIRSSGPPRLVVATRSLGSSTSAMDEAMLRLAEQAVGGALRLQLRERSRLCYRVGHDLALHREGGMVSAFAGMDESQIEAATRGAERAIVDAKGMAESASSIDMLRQAALYELLDEMETVEGLAEVTARLFQRGLPPGHHREVAKAIESVCAERASEMTESLLAPENLRILLIGA